MILYANAAEANPTLAPYTLGAMDCVGKTPVDDVLASDKTPTGCFQAASQDSAEMPLVFCL